MEAMEEREQALKILLQWKLQMKDSLTRQRSTLNPTTFPVSVKNPRLAGYCGTMIERTDIEESSNNIAMNAWLLYHKSIICTQSLLNNVTVSI